MQLRDGPEIWLDRVILFWTVLCVLSELIADTAWERLRCWSDGLSA